MEQEKRRIRMTHTLASARSLYAQGRILEIPEGIPEYMAQNFVNGNCAVYIDKEGKMVGQAPENKMEQPKGHVENKTAGKPAAADAKDAKGHKAPKAPKK